jgi:beta-lactamase regulating signal transducer with metallopeptidase domain
LQTVVRRYKVFIPHYSTWFLMKTSTLLMVSSAMALSLLASVGFFMSSSFAQENMTTATNETGGMMGNQTNQTGGNETQQGPLEQLGKIFGG